MSPYRQPGETPEQLSIAELKEVGEAFEKAYEVYRKSEPRVHSGAAINNLNDVGMSLKYLQDQFSRFNGMREDDRVRRDDVVYEIGETLAEIQRSYDSLSRLLRDDAIGYGPYKGQIGAVGNIIEILSRVC